MANTNNTAGLAIGGEGTAIFAQTESWNGSQWKEEDFLVEDQQNLHILQKQKKI